LASFYGLVVKNHLSQFVLVVRSFWFANEFGLVLEVSLERLLEVRPVRQAFSDSLLGCLGIVQLFETVKVLDLIDYHGNVRGTLPEKVGLPDDIITMVV
jgi:hypothetical protein